MALSNWLHELVEWCVKEGREDVTNWVQYEQRGVHSRDELAQHVVFQQARLAAHTPVTPAAVGSIPGIRTAIAQRRIGTDAGYLVYRQVKSILYQAAVYKQDMKSRELPERVLLVLGLSLGEPKTREALVAAGRAAPGRIISKIVRGGAAEYAELLATLVETRFRTQAGVTLMPTVGRPFFGAQNFLFISAAALAGRYLFNDLMISEAELRDLDQKMAEKSLSVLALMFWMARGDGQFDVSEQEKIEQLKTSLILPGVQPQEMATVLNAPPDWERVRKQFQTEDEKAGLLENILMIVWADGVKTSEEDRMCRRLSAEIVGDRIIDGIETAVRQQMQGPTGPF